MKFSYRLLKKIYPKVPTSEKVADLLTMHLFETEVVNKNVLDVDVLPNRYSDAASHWGIARELGAVVSGKFQVLSSKFQVVIKTPKCRRMIAYKFENIKIKSSPKWMKDIFEDVGLRPINNLVDITNYVTLETGQPIHAFDLDKMEGNLIVRSAKKGEEVVSLDDKKYQLTSHDIVLADNQGALDVAGIKGGKKAEVDKNTKRILLTAGNFDGSSIYKTSRRINLITDASVRFSHQLSPELAAVGINRATELIKELCGGRLKTTADVYPKKSQPSIHKFDIEKFNKISGLNLKEKEALGYLLRLGFKLRPGRLIETPPFRTDIERFEDLVEEIMRVYGYQNLPVESPRVAISPTESDEVILFQRKIKSILVGFGLDEVYNYSFLPEELSEADAIAIENPISRQFAHLRPSLLPLLIKNIDSNYRFFDKVAIFEIGQVFSSEEKSRLGIIIADKKSKTIFELKGVVDGLLERLGLVDYFFREDEGGRLRLESDHTLLGFIKDYGDNKAAVEIDLEELIKLVREEKSYEPLVKYPSVARDISFVTLEETRFSEIMSLIENSAPKYLDDVDLIDSYKNSLTLRLVFQSKEKTLTEVEVNQEVEKITKALVSQLNVEMR